MVRGLASLPKIIKVVGGIGGEGPPSRSKHPPGNQGVADLRVGVIHIGGCVEDAGPAQVLDGTGASQGWVGVVADDGPRSPVQVAVVMGQLVTEVDPVAVLVLAVAAAVVEDAVQDGTNALGLWVRSGGGG